MKTCMLAFALSTTLFAAPALANDPSRANAPEKATDAVAAKDAPEERMVCERVRATGSNKVERVCKTAKQRAAEKESDQARADRDAAERMMRNNRP